MKKIIFLSAIMIFSFSCKKEYTVRNFDTISIEKIKMDSTSIRAIVAVSADELVYAGSRGDIGVTNDGGKTWDIEYTRYQDSIVPQFRSLAKTSSSVFVLSVANPALLYKISAGVKKLVYKEEHEKVFRSEERRVGKE